MRPETLVSHKEVYKEKERDCTKSRLRNIKTKLLILNVVIRSYYFIPIGVSSGLLGSKILQKHCSTVQQYTEISTKSPFFLQGRLRDRLDHLLCERSETRQHGLTPSCARFIEKCSYT